MSRTAITLCLFGALLLGVSALGPPLADADSTPFQIVVHPDNPYRHLERDYVRDLFLKRITRWPDGEVALPVDLSAKSSVRGAFAQAILHKPLTAVRMYWQQVVFSGRGVPPPELETDEAIIRYVVQRRGAIGYITASSQTGEARIVSLK